MRKRLLVRDRWRGAYHCKLLMCLLGFRLEEFKTGSSGINLCSHLRRKLDAAQRAVPVSQGPEQLRMTASWFRLCLGSIVCLGNLRDLRRLRTCHFQQMKGPCEACMSHFNLNQLHTRLCTWCLQLPRFRSSNTHRTKSFLALPAFLAERGACANPLTQNRTDACQICMQP